MINGPVKTIDLFSGCGGLSEGFEKTGKYNFIAHVEWENAPCKTLKKRISAKWKYSDPEDRVIHFDIQRTKELLNGWNDDEFYGSCYGLRKLTDNAKGIDLIIGGPPCQAYSLAGRIRDEHGMQFDYRNYLFESYLDIVRNLKPSIIVFENVPGILSAKPGGILIANRIREAFSAAGYELVEDFKKYALIDFKLFGVPQNRTRVILFGLNKMTFKGNRQQLIKHFYADMLSKRQKSKIHTVKDAILDMPEFYPSKEDYRNLGRTYSHKPFESNIANHSPRYHNRRDIDIFHTLAQDIEDGICKYTSIEYLKQLYTEKTNKISNVHKYYVLRWSEPSNTIPAHLFKDGLRHIHPDPKQSRSITVREAARLQTFDDDYVFLGSMGDQYKMIGNAVPPKFAKELGSALWEFIENYL